MLGITGSMGRFSKATIQAFAPAALGSMSFAQQRWFFNRRLITSDIIITCEITRDIRVRVRFPNTTNPNDPASIGERLAGENFAVVALENLNVTREAIGSEALNANARLRDQIAEVERRANNLIAQTRAITQHTKEDMDGYLNDMLNAQDLFNEGVQRETQREARATGSRIRGGAGWGTTHASVSLNWVMATVTGLLNELLVGYQASPGMPQSQVRFREFDTNEAHEQGVLSSFQRHNVLPSTATVVWDLQFILDATRKAIFCYTPSGRQL